MQDERGLRQRDKKKILERDCFICAYCDGIADVVDHVVPFSWSMSNDEYNLVACCLECNQIAYNRVFSSFMEKRRYVREKRLTVKWQRKILKKQSICIDCKKPYKVTKHSSCFMCPECYKKEHKTKKERR